MKTFIALARASRTTLNCGHRRCHRSLTIDLLYDHLYGVRRMTKSFDR